MNRSANENMDGLPVGFLAVRVGYSPVPLRPKIPNLCLEGSPSVGFRSHSCWFGLYLSLHSNAIDSARRHLIFLLAFLVHE
jgi:hypothetical protein